MDDLKRDSVNKTKRTKNDHVHQAVVSYLQKRNYPHINPQEITPEQLNLAMLVESETGKPNSISYSCFNSEPVIIDHDFTKILAWLKDAHKSDLEVLIGPLFCHLYLEIFQRGQEDRASSFFKTHLPAVEQIPCDESIKELINAISNVSPDLSHLKKQFRSNKYVLNLSGASVVALKKFLHETCHMVILQVLQSCFQINEVEDVEASDGEVKIEEKIVNGHADVYCNNAKQKLFETIANLQKEPLPMFKVHLGNVKDEVSCGMISRDNGFIIYSYNSSIFIRSILALKQLCGMDDYSQEVVIHSHTAKIFDFSLVQNKNLMVSASQDKTVRLFDLRDYSLQTIYKGHDSPVYCVATSSNGFYIASGSYDHTARLWAVNRSETLRMCVGHAQEITSVVFHPNSTYFATGSADKNIRMWSINDPGPVRLFVGSKGVIYALCYSSCGKYIASAGDDKRLRIWDLVAAKQLFEIKTGSEPITKIAWSTDTKSLMAGTIDGIVRRWDYEALACNPSDTNLHNPASSVSLNYKLLALEYCYGTFACLTTQTQPSTYLGT